MQISNIDASLSQGNFLCGKKLAVLLMGLFAMLLVPLISVIFFVIMIITAEWSMEIVFVLVFGDVFFLSFFAVFVFLKLKNNKLKEKITMWLEDALEVKAYSKKIGENELGFQPKGTKIQVSFKIEGKPYIKDSTAKVFGGWEGYIGTFNKYADREIDILYSPRYDEVLILKNHTYKH
jgi:hypothetical protein